MAFDKDFIKTLERLNIVARRTLTGFDTGSHKTQNKGGSVEFADYRSYSPGDEIRYIDWNIYAKRDSLFVKEFQSEENIHIALFVDTSKSMDFGSPTKLEFAKNIAAAIGYVGLVNFESVSLYTFSDQMIESRKFLRGRSMVFELLSNIEALEPKGITKMTAAFADALPKLRGRSMAVIVTDLLDSEGYEDALKKLLAWKFEVHLVHIVAPEELEPTDKGRITFIDSESGGEKELTLSAGVIAKYKAAFEGYCEDVKSFCIANETFYTRLASNTPLDDAIVKLVKEGRILQEK